MYNNLDAFKLATGNMIAEADLRDDTLCLTFTDGSQLTLRDDEYRCCETRFMRTDDQLSDFVGKIFDHVEVRDAVTVEIDDCDTKDIQFLVVYTSGGVFSVSTHNNHNGFYSGFALVASYSEPAPQENAALV